MMGRNVREGLRVEGWLTIILKARFNFCDHDRRAWSAAQVMLLRVFRDLR